MRKFRLTSMNTICNLCLAMMFMVRFSKMSFCFFGEPKYPVAEDYEQTKASVLINRGLFNYNIKS